MHHRMGGFLLLPALALVVASAWAPVTFGDPQATLLNLGCSQYNATPAFAFIAALNSTFASLRANLSAAGGGGGFCHATEGSSPSTAAAGEGSVAGPVSSSAVVMDPYPTPGPYGGGAHFFHGHPR